MKLLKQYTFILTVLILIVVNRETLPAYAESVKLDVSTASEEVQVGRSFDVVLTANCTNSNVAAIQLEIGYDTKYISFKSLTSKQKAEVYTNATDGGLKAIILLQNSMQSGQMVVISFTAKSGNEASTQQFSFKIIDAVNSDSDTLAVDIDESINISISKGGQTTEQVNSKVQNDVSSTGKTNATHNNSNSKSNSSSASKATAQKTESNTKSMKEGSEAEVNGSYTDSENSIAPYQRGFGEDSINQGNEKTAYIAAGAGIAVGVMVVLVTVFRLGQLSHHKIDI